MNDETTELWEKYQASKIEKVYANKSLEIARAALALSEKDAAEAQAKCVKAWEAWSIAAGPR